MSNNRDGYIRQDELGRWINTEFPPASFVRYPNNSGYKNANSELLFYQFAVQYYNLRINYNGKEYIALVDGDGACITDGEYNQIGHTYRSANDLIKHFTFPDGEKLVDLVRGARKIAMNII